MRCSTKPEFWVAVAFVLFVGVLVYVGVHRMLARRSTSAAPASRPSSTRHAACATRPRSCSPNISASGSEAEREAQDIIAGAKAEAERLAAEAKAKVEEFVARRTKMAETKIAQAEAQAPPMCAPPPPTPRSPPPRRSSRSRPRASSPTN